MVIAFDIIGTLFSMGKVKSRLGDEGVPEESLDIWFERMVQSSMAATLSGRYFPYREVGETTLKQVFAKAGIREDLAGLAVRTMHEIELWEDAADTLHALKMDGHHRIIAITNSSIAFVDPLLERSGIRDIFDLVFSADESLACKPHPAPYRMALDRVTAVSADAIMVAAHGWDILGADSAGMKTVYVTRLEKQWPFPGIPPGQVASDLYQVPETIMKSIAIGIS